MTATTLVDGLAPPVGREVTQTLVMLANRFPGAVVWYGAFSRKWWAMVRAKGRWWLIEGATPEELTGAIVNALR